MTHRYGQPITVTLAEDRPSSFSWRGWTYRVLEVLAIWHVQDRWWAGAHGASDRTYYRLRCEGELYCELYSDAAAACWILDRIYD